MKNILLVLVSSLVILAGCAVPAPIVKVTPSTLQNRDYWNMGQQFLYANDKEVWFDCAFNRVEGDKLIFDVKVNNLSDTTVLVDPAVFSQVVYVDDSTKLTQNLAFDPEMVLTQLKLDENVAAANARNGMVFGVCSAIIATGTIVAVAASKKDLEKKEKLINTVGAASDVAQIATVTTVESNNARAENSWTTRRSLEEQFLRKTTLPKDFYIDGEVHFPFSKTAKWYEITLSAGKSKATFLFKQQFVYSQPYSTAAGNR